MAKFDFRLQKVLEYREMEEDWAKQAFLECRAARFGIETELAAIEDERSALVREAMVTVADYQAMEGCSQRLDDMEHQAEVRLAVIVDEESKAEDVWLNKRMEVESLRKLREQAHDEWLAEEARSEQRALDEWSVMRRTA